MVRLRDLSVVAFIRVDNFQEISTRFYSSTENDFLIGYVEILMTSYSSFISPIFTLDSESGTTCSAVAEKSYPGTLDDIMPS